MSLVADALTQAGGPFLGGSLIAITNNVLRHDIVLLPVLLCKVADFGLSRALGKSKHKTMGNASESECYRSAAGVYPIRSTAVGVLY